MKILEIKRHLNKPDESYLCDLLKRGNGYVVLKYVSKQSGRVAGITLEVGSTTYACYRTGQGYVLWRMFGPDHKLKGHLFHICRDQQVEEDRVEYLDLLLDVWIDGEGQLTILDRDEVEACAAIGVLGEQDLAWIARQEREIIENWSQIISDFDLLQGVLRA
jgi:predicted RNA-binding protein associated with RNAse of E/G family